MNEQELIRKAMGALGSRKSAAKAAASRANGKLGGRPKDSGKKVASSSPTKKDSGGQS